jgi:hypothetical protein
MKPGKPKKPRISTEEKKQQAGKRRRSATESSL